MFKTPIVLFIYKREKKTKLIFDQIKKIKPEKLLVIADGPKNSSEMIVCDKTRNVFDQIDWNCQIFKNYSDINLGLKKRFFSGIDWVFQLMDEAIFLEDDTLPSQSFFYFCQELLEKHKKDEEVGMICGSNLGANIEIKNSYSFLPVCFIWGWATWKRSWDLLDRGMSQLNSFNSENVLETLGYKKKYNKKMINFLLNTKLGKINTWDAYFVFTMLLYKKMNIVPHQNLVSNIGFDSDATHTRNFLSWFSKIDHKEISFPLQFPKKIEINHLYLKKILKIHNYSKFDQIFNKLFFQFKKIINSKLS